jgi:hypothetical protein
MRWCAAYLHSRQTFLRHIARLDHGLGRSPPPWSIAEQVIVRHGAAQASRGRCCGLSRCGASLQPEISAPYASQAPARKCASGYGRQRRSQAHTKMSNCQPLHSSKQSAVYHGTGLQCEGPRPHALCMGPAVRQTTVLLLGSLQDLAPEPGGSSFCDDVQQQNARLCRRKVSERSHMCRSAESETTSVQSCRQSVVMLQLCMAQPAARSMADT